MKQFFLELIQPNTAKSSSRFINLVGFWFMSLWVTYYVITSGLTYDILLVYSIYCGGNYMGNKYFSNRSDYPNTLQNDQTVYNDYNNPNNPNIPNNKGNQNDRTYGD